MLGKILDRAGNRAGKAGLSGTLRSRARKNAGYTPLELRS